MSMILLVDDRDETCEAYAELLRYSGHNVACAQDGLEACVLARDLHPDLIVMDLRMPVLNGWEAARRLRADSRTADIPIVALSAYAHPEELDPRHAECGFAAVWLKPLSPLVLLEQVERLTQERGAPAAAESLQAGESRRVQGVGSSG
jgi:two-component system cell cycle response regulator DivK